MKFYRTILQDALRSSWKNKYLWFFGLFVTLLGSGLELNIIFGDYGGGGTGLFSEFNKWSATGLLSRQGWVNIGQLAIQDPFTFFILISVLLAALILFVLVIWISITSQAALVYNAGRIRLEKNHDFKDGFKAGLGHFWPIFSLNLGLRVFLGLFFSLLSLYIIRNQSETVLERSGIIFVLLFLVFIPISVVLTFLIKYAIAFVVIKGEKALTAIKKSWELFFDNWLLSLEMAALLFLVSILAALIIIITFLILMAPLLFIVILFQNLFSVINVFMVLIAVMVMYVIATIVFGSFLMTFQTLAWINLFIELISKGGVSKLNRIFSEK